MKQRGQAQSRLPWKDWVSFSFCVLSRDLITKGRERERERERERGRGREREREADRN